MAVPPIDEDIALDSGKTLNVNIGNITNTMNLTYGERTGACMRIGGAFNGLFKHCIEDPNGFHIRFTDPDTGEFVSRVSGTRNGNSLFLNELRYSCSENFDNNDVVECMKKAAQLIVERTKNDPAPIENVIITTDYAMGGEAGGEEKLPISNMSEALHGAPFNYMQDRGYVLVGARNEDESLDIRLGEENSMTYAPLRDNVKHVMGSQAEAEVIKKIMINGLLNQKDGQGKVDIEALEYEKDPAYIELKKAGITEAWVGQDYFLYTDEKGQMHRFEFDRYRGSKEIESEINNIAVNVGIGR
jgi:hypothetical protein